MPLLEKGEVFTYERRVFISQTPGCDDFGVMVVDGEARAVDGDLKPLNIGETDELPLAYMEGIVAALTRAIQHIKETNNANQ